VALYNARRAYGAHDPVFEPSPRAHAGMNSAHSSCSEGGALCTGSVLRAAPGRSGRALRTWRCAAADYHRPASWHGTLPAFSNVLLFQMHLLPRLTAGAADCAAAEPRWVVARRLEPCQQTR
jgi:hypothetical protein